MIGLLLYLLSKNNFRQKYCILRTSWTCRFTGKRNWKLTLIRSEIPKIGSKKAVVINFSLEGYEKKPGDILYERQVKQSSTGEEPSTSIHTLVKNVDAEDYTKRENDTFDLPQVITIVTSELKSGTLPSETCFKPWNHVSTKNGTEKKLRTSNLELL